MKRAFSLIELLVAIAFVAALAGMLLPVIALVKQSANGVNCASHLRQWDMAIMAYCGENEGWTPDTAPVLSNGSTVGWNHMWAPLAVILRDSTSLDSDGLNNASWIRGNTINGCPLRSPATSSASPYSWRYYSYGMNWHISGHYNPGTLGYEGYASTSPYYKTIYSIPNRSSTVMFLDLVNFKTSIGVNKLPARLSDIGYDHNGRTNAVFVDGHVEALIKAMAEKQLNPP